MLNGEVVFKEPTINEEKVMLGGSGSDTDSSLSEKDENGYEAKWEKCCCHVCSRTKWTKAMKIINSRPLFI